MCMQPPLTHLRRSSTLTEDDRVVVTASKNNDGELGPRTAWQRKAGWFEPVAGFNFEQFDGGNLKREPKVKEEHLRELFEEGHRRMMLKHAAERLEEIAQVGRSAAYEALKIQGGRFSHLLTKEPDTGLIGLRNVKPGPEPEAG
jgi:hypothetical protein